MGDGTECTLSKFADHSESGWVFDRADGCAATQRDEGRLEKGAKVQQNENAKLLPLGRNNARHQYRLGVYLQKSWAETLRSAGWCFIGHEPPMHHGGNEGSAACWMNQEKHCWLVKGKGFLPSAQFWLIKSGVLGQVHTSPEQERCGDTGVSLVKGRRNHRIIKTRIIKSNPS